MLTEVGDEQVIDQLDGTADRAHGQQDSASMMAGSVSDTITHPDDHGERVTVAPGASKAGQVDAKAARTKAAPGKTKPAPKAAPAASSSVTSQAPAARAVASTPKVKPAAQSRSAQAVASTPSVGKPAASSAKGAPEASGHRPRRPCPRLRLRKP